MTKEQILEKIGINIYTVKKYIIKYNLKSFDDLNEIELLELLANIFNENREKMIKMKREINDDKEKLKKEKEDVNKKLELLAKEEQFLKEEKEKLNKEFEELSQKIAQVEKKENELLKKEEILNQKIEEYKRLEKERENIKKELKFYKEQQQKLIENELEQLRRKKEIELQEILDKKRVDFELELLKKREEFLKEEKEKFNQELKKLSQEISQVEKKENELFKKESELVRREELLDQKIKIFEASKEDEEKKLEEKLKLKEKEFIAKLQEWKVKKIEEANKKIDELYKNKEEELDYKEKELNEKEVELKIKEKELNILEKELNQKENSIEDKVYEIMEQKIKNYESKIERLEEEIEILREERDELVDEINVFQRNQDKDIIKELEDKRAELREKEKYYKNLIEEKNSEIEIIKNRLQELKEKNKEILDENEKLRVEIEEIERIKSENRILREKLKDLSIIEAEKEELRKKLEAIRSSGKELEQRIEDIKDQQKKLKINTKLENKQDIENEIVWLENIKNSMEAYGVKYPKRLLYAFHTALKSASFSPLTVLAGVSGTGKSELPKLYSYFGGFNFLAEAVQPNWDSPESMMGYYNTIEDKFDATNILKFIVRTSLSKDEDEYGYKESMNMILLDEMNLAHIELYFAEFLSKFEQKRGSKDVFIDIKIGAGYSYNIPLDNNLLWVGTMNEDETTKALSDKVLDRSFVINFPRPKELLSRNKLISLDEVNEFRYLDRDTWDSWIQKKSLFKDDKKSILNNYKQISNEINKHLSKTGRAIGHRVWQSMEFYINNHPNVIQNIDNLNELEKAVKMAFEEQLVQKIMPKLRGIETHGKEKEVLNSIKELLSKNNFTIQQDFENAMDNPYGQFIWNSAEYLKAY